MLVAACCLVAGSCAGRQATPETPGATGQPRARRIPGLPIVPFSVSQSSSAFQRLFEGIEDALADTLPEPAVESEPAYRRYMDEELTPWLERRGAAILSAERRLAALDQEPEGERALGRALIAYLAERTREDVLDAPVPNERSRPDRATALRDAWRERLEPLHATAHRQWTGCVEVLSMASPELARWKQRCEDELAEPPARQPN